MARNEFRNELAWTLRTALGFPVPFFRPDRHTRPVLIYGVGRSGTTWLGRTLAQAETPLRYLQEPLTYFKPRFLFSGENDRLSTGWRDTSGFLDPMYRMYRLLSHRDVNLRRALHRYTDSKALRNDPNPQVTLFKEVHGLLAIGAVVARLDCPAILVTRDPVRIIDSLFAYQHLSTPIWRNERAYLLEDSAVARYLGDRAEPIRDNLRRFVDDGINRRGTVVGKALTVAVISALLKQQAQADDRIRHVVYEALCLNPLDGFAACADHLSLSFSDSLEEKVAGTSAVDGVDRHPTRSFQKVSERQLSKEFSFLSPQEVGEISVVLADCGLACEAALGTR